MECMFSCFFLNAKYISCSFKHISKYTKKNLIAFYNHMKFTNNYVVSFIVNFFQIAKNWFFSKSHQAKSVTWHAQNMSLKLRFTKFGYTYFMCNPFFLAICNLLFELGTQRLNLISIGFGICLACAICAKIETSKHWTLLQRIWKWSSW